ncbi:hypothetical protein C7M84_004925 [Penaeus vannamei]|uniref:Uncharacterized protein n=1 Tax=Penaeus vannamei TaxID=6689 RepID=A0A3R7QSD3_PENVA|nr:hypothetical protein C7M84_004925 [Penaeus vannamei]
MINPDIILAVNTPRPVVNGPRNALSIPFLPLSPILSSFPSSCSLPIFTFLSSSFSLLAPSVLLFLSFMFPSSSLAFSSFLISSLSSSLSFLPSPSPSSPFPSSLFLLLSPFSFSSPLFLSPSELSFPVILPISYLFSHYLSFSLLPLFLYPVTSTPSSSPLNHLSTLRLLCSSLPFPLLLLSLSFSPPLFLSLSLHLSTSLSSLSLVSTLSSPSPFYPKLLYASSSPPPVLSDLFSPPSLPLPRPSLPSSPLPVSPLSLPLPLQSPLSFPPSPSLPLPVCPFSPLPLSPADTSLSPFQAIAISAREQISPTTHPLQPPPRKLVEVCQSLAQQNHVNPVVPNKRCSNLRNHLFASDLNTPRPSRISAEQETAVPSPNLRGPFSSQTPSSCAVSQHHTYTTTTHHTHTISTHCTLPTSVAAQDLFKNLSPPSPTGAHKKNPLPQESQTPAKSPQTPRDFRRPPPRTPSIPGE